MTRMSRKERKAARKQQAALHDQLETNRQLRLADHRKHVVGDDPVKPKVTVFGTGGNATEKDHAALANTYGSRPGVPDADSRYAYAKLNPQAAGMGSVYTPKPVTPYVHHDRAKAKAADVAAKANGTLSTITQDPSILELLDMFSFCTPARSATEQEFFDRYVAPVVQAQDGYGNGWKRIDNADGSPPKVLWSSHTDTVHHETGYQKVEVYDGKVFAGQGSSCLGGDDKAGVWIMLEMIRAGVPGMYIFHREEEIGGHGSSYIAENCGKHLHGLEFAVAFDRKDYHSIITFQGGKRTCSDKFAEQMAGLLGSVAGRKAFEDDDSGLFTDTKNYIDLIGECTNLSVGYFNAHSANEYQDLEFIAGLRDRMVSVDWSQLIAHRKPGEKEPAKVYSYGGYGGYGGYGSGYSHHGNYGRDDDGYVPERDRRGNIKADQPEVDEIEEEVAPLDKALLRYVSLYPEEVARFLQENAIDREEIEAYWFANFAEEIEVDEDEVDPEKAALHDAAAEAASEAKLVAEAIAEQQEQDYYSGNVPVSDDPEIEAGAIFDRTDAGRVH